MDLETVHTFQPDDGREGAIVQVDKQNGEVQLIVGRGRVVMTVEEARELSAGIHAAVAYARYSRSTRLL